MHQKLECLKTAILGIKFTRNCNKHHEKYLISEFPTLSQLEQYQDLVRKKKSQFYFHDQLISPRQKKKKKKRNSQLGKVKGLEIIMKVMETTKHPTTSATNLNRCVWPEFRNSFNLFAISSSISSSSPASRSRSLFPSYLLTSQGTWKLSVANLRIKKEEKKIFLQLGN